MVKNLPEMQETGSIPGLGRSPVEDVLNIHYRIFKLLQESLNLSLYQTFANIWLIFHIISRKIKKKNYMWGHVTILLKLTLSPFYILYKIETHLHDLQWPTCLHLWSFLGFFSLALSHVLKTGSYVTRAETHKQKLPQEEVPGEENLKHNCEVCWRLSVDNLMFNRWNSVMWSCGGRVMILWDLFPKDQPNSHSK